MKWPEDGEYDFAGLLLGSLVCHLKFTKDWIYLDDDNGERGVYVESLEEAVGMMAKYQVGKELSAENVATITAFLQALTGEYKGETLVNDNMK